MSDDKHNCIACPVEVRGLYAAASNALGAWSRSDDRSRIAHKMDELRDALDRIEPIVTAHFDGLNLLTNERTKPAQGEPVSVADQRKYGVIR